MIIDIQFLDSDTEQQRTSKLRMLVEEIVRLGLSTGETTTTDSSGLAGAQYILAGSNALLPSAYQLSAGSGLQLVLADGVAALSVTSVPLSSLSSIASGVLLGRYTAGNGEPQVIGIGAGLELTTGGVLQVSSSTGYSPVLGHAGI